MAKQAYTNQRELTAFLGSFYGLWLNLITFVLPVVSHVFVVSHFGVGGALQIMPCHDCHRIGRDVRCARCLIDRRDALNRSGDAIFVQPNRHGTAVLPLPIELRNRTKAFTDIFMDRFSRGLGGIILIFLTGTLDLSVRQLSIVVFRLYDRLGLPLAFAPRTSTCRRFESD